jgi:hypothetical protein
LNLPKHSLAQNVGVDTTSPNISVQLDVASTTKGLLIPRMTLAQRAAIPKGMDMLKAQNKLMLKLLNKNK